MKTIFISFLSNLRFCITILLVFGSSSIYSADCKFGLTSRHYHNAKLVILGTIVDKVDVEEHVLEIHLDIQEDFKGTNVDCILIGTHYFRMPFEIGDQVLYIGPDYDRIWSRDYFYGCSTGFLVLRPSDQYESTNAYLSAKAKMEYRLEVIRFTKSFNDPKFCHIANEKKIYQFEWYGGFQNFYERFEGKFRLILYQVKIKGEDEIQIIMDESSLKYYDVIKDLYADLKLVCSDGIYNGTTPVGILYVEGENLLIPI